MKKTKKQTPAKKLAVKPKPDDARTAKKVTATSKKLAKQRKVIAQAEAAAPLPKVRRGTKTVREAESKLTTSVQPSSSKHEPPRIECRLIIADHSVEIDPASLERTLGCANYAGKGLLDQWPDQVWAALLSYLDLPAFPLDRAVAVGPVRRLVQKVWYQAIKGGVPEESQDRFGKRDVDASEKYKEDFKHVEEVSEERSARAKTNLASFQRSSTLEGQNIKMVAKENPYKLGTKAYATFELIAKCKTVAEVRSKAEAGKHDVGYLRYASRDGYIKLT